MEYHKINIALVPPLSVQRQAFDIASMLHKRGSIYDIRDSENIHLTLYYSSFPVKNLKRLISELKSILEHEHPLRIYFSNIRDDGEYIASDFRSTRRIKGLHLKILNKINPLREGYLREKYRSDNEHFRSLAKKKKEMVVKWGHPYVDELFLPHLTLGQFDTSRDFGKINKDEIKWNIRSMILNEVIVYEQGPLEGPYKAIAKFRLK